MILACKRVSDGLVIFGFVGAARLQCFLELVRVKRIVDATVQFKGRGSKDHWNPKLFFFSGSAGSSECSISGTSSSQNGRVTS